MRDLMFEAIDYLRAKDLLTVPAVAAESLHMIMMTPERQLVNPFFTGGIADQRVVPDRHDGVRRAHPEHARQQHAVLARDGVPRDDPRPQPRRSTRARGSPAYRPRLGGESPVLRRGLAALLGTAAVRPGLPRHAREEGRRAVLAHAPLRAHHLLAQVPHGRVVAAGVRRLPRRPRRLRARQRDGRGPPLVPGRLRPALPGGLPARRPAAAVAAHGTRRQRADGAEGVPRRGPAAGRDAHRAAAPRAQPPAADEGHVVEWRFR